MGSYLNPLADQPLLSPQQRYLQMLQSQNLAQQIAAQSQPPQLQPPGDVAPPAVGQGSQTGPVMPPTTDSIAAQLQGLPPGAPPGTPPLPQQPAPPPPQPGTVQMPGPVGTPPPAPPPPPNPLEAQQQVVLERQKAVEQTAQQLQQYHPSLAKKILGSVLGGLAGISNPALGMQVGQAIAYSSPQQRAYDLAKRQLEIAQQGFGVTAETEKQRLDVRKQAAEEERIKQQTLLQKWQMDPARLTEERETARQQGKTGTQMEGTDKDGVSRGLWLDYPSGKIIDPRTGREANPADFPNGIDFPKMAVAGAQIAGRAAVEASREQAARTIQGIKGAQAEELEKLRSDDASTRQIQLEKLRQQDRLGLEDARHVDRMSEITARLNEMEKLRTQFPTTAQRNSAGFATIAQDVANRTNSEIDAMAGEFGVGPASGRILDFWVNKLGMDNPAWAALNTNLESLAAEAARVSTNSSRPSQQEINIFRDKFRGAQTVGDLKARINEIIKTFGAVQETGGVGAGSTPTTRKPSAPVAPPGAAVPDFIWDPKVGDFVPNPAARR